MANENVAARSDPASLQYLNDIVVPDRAPWLPAATGWYVLGFLTLAFALWLIGLAIHRWWTRRYRREAIDQLNEIRQSSSTRSVAETVTAVDQLLKRVALAAWRNQRQQPNPRNPATAVRGKLRLLSAMCDD